MRKNLPLPQAIHIIPKVFVIIKTKVQLNMTAIADATPLTSAAKSSPLKKFKCLNYQI